MRRYRLILIVCLLAGFCARHSYAQQQQQWLEVGQQRLPATLYKSRKAPMSGGVVVLVAGGNSSEWPHSLHALGRHLPDDGWATLRVDLHAAVSATELPAIEQLVQEINAATELMRKDGVQNIVLVAAGGIAFQALQATMNPQIARLQGLVLLDLSTTETLPEPGLVFAALQMPVLDLLTRRDAGEDAALQRKLLAQQYDVPNYRQTRAPAAGPNWHKHRDPIVQRVRGWLRRNWK